MSAYLTQEVDLLLKSQEYLNTILTNEKEDMKNKNWKYKTICESWAKSCKIFEKCVNEHVPHQIRVIIGGDFDTFASLLEVYSIYKELRQLPSRKTFYWWQWKIFVLKLQVCQNKDNISWWNNG